MGVHHGWVDCMQGPWFPQSIPIYISLRGKKNRALMMSVTVCRESTEGSQGGGVACRHPTWLRPSDRNIREGKTDMKGCGLKEAARILEIESTVVRAAVSWSPCR